MPQLIDAYDLGKHIDDLADRVATEAERRASRLRSAFSISDCAADVVDLIRGEVESTAARRSEMRKRRERISFKTAMESLRDLLEREGMGHVYNVLEAATEVFDYGLTDISGEIIKRTQSFAALAELALNYELLFKSAIADAILRQIEAECGRMLASLQEMSRGIIEAQRILRVLKRATEGAGPADTSQVQRAKNHVDEAIRLLSVAYIGLSERGTLSDQPVRGAEKHINAAADALLKGRLAETVRRYMERPRGYGAQPADDRLKNMQRLPRAYFDTAASYLKIKSLARLGQMLGERVQDLYALAQDVGGKNIILRTSEKLKEVSDALGTTIDIKAGKDDQAHVRAISAVKLRAARTRLLVLRAQASGDITNRDSEWLSGAIILMQDRFISERGLLSDVELGVHMSMLHLGKMFGRGTANAGEQIFVLGRSVSTLRRNVETYYHAIGKHIGISSAAHQRMYGVIEGLVRGMGMEDVVEDLLRGRVLERASYYARHVGSGVEMAGMSVELLREVCSAIKDGQEGVNEMLSVERERARQVAIAGVTTYEDTINARMAELAMREDLLMVADRLARLPHIEAVKGSVVSPGMDTGSGPSWLSGILGIHL